MTHLGHLVRWDIRRFRALLSLWLLIVVATATMEAIWPQFAADPRTRQLVGTIANLLALTEVLLGAVLIAQVVQAHALVGTTAFWMTRPVPIASLLSAKLALLAVAMIAAPVVAEIVVMAIYQVPTSDIIGVSMQSAYRWALWIGALVTAAALTPNLAKYALLIGSALIATIVMITVLAAVAMYRFQTGPPQGHFALYSGGEPLMFWGAPDPTSDLVSAVLMLATLMILLGVQYRTRRRELAFTTGVIGALVVWFAASFWPWPFLAPAIATPPWAADPLMLSLSAAADTVAIEPIAFRDQAVDWREARARLRLSGLEPGWTASVGVRSAAVQMPGGAQLISDYPGYPSSVQVEEHGDGPQQREVIRNVLGVGSLIDQHPNQPGEKTVVLFARGVDLSRIAPSEGTYQGQFYVGLTHHAVETALSPIRGAIYRNGPYRLSIAGVQLSTGRLTMLAVQSDAVSVFARRPPAIRSLYLRNRRRSEAIYLPAYDLRAEASLLRFVPLGIGVGQEGQTGFSARAEMLYFAPRADETTVSFALDQSWLNDAELVIVRSTPGGSVDRQLAIANFPIRSQ